MKNILLSSILVFLAISLYAQGPAQKYRVMIATYDKPVASDYFTHAGLDDVVLEIDKNNFARYYVQGKFATESEAIQVQELVIEKGFKNARVVDLDKLAEECASVCKPIPVNKSLDRHGVVGIIYFGFDKDVLRTASKQELDELHNILLQYPDIKVKLQAHTDGLGSDTYNMDLAQRRANSAKNYLIQKGIDASRLTAEVMGEKKPVAKNATDDGKDLPEGRQYNRRVEFVLTDGQGRIMSDMVEDVYIPNELKAY